MFPFGKKHDLHEFTPPALHDAMAEGRVVLVDVRERSEFDTARIEGAVNLPLSRFEPASIPAGEIVLYCGVGKRSRMAADLCTKAGVKVAGHLAGGLSAWSAAGLPISYG